MSHDDFLDLELPSMSRLPVLTPNQDRAKRLRAGCRARLARRKTEPRRRFGLALLAGSCLLYLSAIVHDMLRWRGML